MTEDMKITAEEFRAKFPSLSDTVHAASCSQGAISEHVHGALAEYAYTLRRSGAPWDAWMETVERARAEFAAFVGASVNDIAIVPSASVGAFQAVSALSFDNRPVIVAMANEFPSVGQVFGAQAPSGAEVRWVTAEEMSRVGVVEAYRACVDERTALVSIPLALYTNGTVQPVAEVSKIAREYGARVFVDAYQGAGVVPFDVQELDVDYAVAGSLKYLLGLPGIAFLYAREGVTDQRMPHLTGWFGRVNPMEFDPTSLDFPPAARRFESGTPAIPAAFAALAGLETLAEVNAEDVWGHVAGLVAQTRALLGAAGEKVDAPHAGASWGPQVALLDPEPERIARHLSGRRIITSPRGSALRISWHYYNTADDVAAVVSAIREYRTLRGEDLAGV